MSGLVMSRPRQSRAPAFVAAVLLHAGVLALVLFAPGGPPKPIGSSVPINIVSSAPSTDTRPAVQAPQTQAAQAPQPVPEAKPQPPAPVPAPAPAFTETRPQPPVKAERPTPTPQPSLKAAAQPAAKPFDFDRLQQIIANAKHNEGAQASNAQRGAARPETAPEPRPDAGQGLSQSDLVGLTQLLERMWRLDCSSPGLAAVNPKVKFTVGLDGRLAFRPTVLGGLEQSSDPIVAVGARQAVDAVHAVTPLPAQYYGQTITANFNAKEACAKR